MAGNPSDSNTQNTFLEFLQRGKFVANMQKLPTGPPIGVGMPPHQGMENNNLQQDFQPQPQPQPPTSMPHQQQMLSNHGPLSVEELEARLRQTGPSTSTSSNNIPNDVSMMKNSQQQDMIAFKKLVNMLGF